MPEGNPLSIFAPGLNALGVPWMAVGSIASSAYGERRSTLDLDVVALVGRQDAARFLAAFPETEFYCPPTEVIRAESARPEHGHFNLIHQNSIYKADIYVATGSAFERWAFKNRRPLVVGETPVWLAPPEYVIVAQAGVLLRRRQRKTSVRYSRRARGNRCGSRVFGKRDRAARPC